MGQDLYGLRKLSFAPEVVGCLFGGWGRANLGKGEKMSYKVCLDLLFVPGAIRHSVTFCKSVAYER